MPFAISQADRAAQERYSQLRNTIIWDGSVLKDRFERLNPEQSEAVNRLNPRVAAAIRACGDIEKQVFEGDAIPGDDNIKAAEEAIEKIKYANGKIDEGLQNLRAQTNDATSEHANGQNGHTNGQVNGNA